MLAQSSPQASPWGWLIFALMTVGCWGIYGIFLHKGSIGMKVAGSSEPADILRYKAFLFVGIAYFLVAIVGPAVLLMMRGATWSFPSYGLWMSLVAGIVGALGAFGVLLAFGQGGPPATVMTIIFAGAPVINALVIITFIDKNWNEVNWKFILGIVLAAAGGAMATFFKPPSKPHAAKPPLPHVQPAEPPATASAPSAEPTHKS